jgi:LacI family transcriptional regulator
MLRNVYSERYRGFRQALADRNTEFDENFLFITDMSEAAGIELAERIIKMKQCPDGIFTSNDTAAVTLMVGLQRAGIKIPEDIAVAGFNNEPISQVIQPNLTTIDYPAKEIGEIAASSLIGLLKNSGSANLSTIVLKHKLIIRESSMKLTNKNI